MKKPLCCSLHEICKIIGPEKAERDLFHIIETILKEKSDSLRYGVISHLAEFLEVFDT